CQLGQEPFQKRLVGRRIKLPLFQTAGIEPSPKAIEYAEDAVGFADAARLGDGLAAFEGPSVAERPPLSKASLVAKEHERLLGLRRSDNLRPSLFEPEKRRLHIGTGRTEFGLLIGQTQLVEQVGNIARMVDDLKPLTDQVGDQHGSPA